MKHPESIYIFKFNPINVLHHLTKLDSGTHVDVLDIDSRLLRAAATVLAPSLTHFLNIFIKFGFIPTDWKLARVNLFIKERALVLTRVITDLFQCLAMFVTLWKRKYKLKY